MQTVRDEVPPAVKPVAGPVTKEGAARLHFGGRAHTPVVWVRSPSHLINEALGALLAKAGCEGESGAEVPPHADLAMWDLRGLSPPYPLPPGVPTLALIGESDAAKLGALSVGYRGYLSGEEAADEVGRAVRAVLRGDVWAERRVLNRVLNRLVTSGPPTLTERETQVLTLLLQGLSNKGIAKRLGLAEKTVKVYVSELLYKYESKNRAELILRHERERSFERRAKDASRTHTGAP